jgi:hypothetical protein
MKKSLMPPSWQLKEAVKNAKTDIDLARYLQSGVAVMAAQMAALRKYRQVVIIVLRYALKQGPTLQREGAFIVRGQLQSKTSVSGNSLRGCADL